MIKLQPLGEDSDRDASDAFLAYCERVCSVTSVNVAAPYTYGTTTTNGTLYGYTTRQFVSGTALSAFELPLDEDSVVRCGVQVARALDAMHARDLRHHDLKPENVVVKRAAGNVIDALAQCMLIDISFRPESTEGAALNEVTLQYVAPELLGGEQGDHRADLYSLGVLLYTVTTGRLPFPGDSVGTIIRNQRSRNYPPISNFSRTSPELTRVVERLLEPYPDNRYDSAQDVIAALAECGDDAAGANFGFHAAGGLVGRRQELAECLASLGFGEGHGVSCIEVSGAAQSGVTAVLREVQDRAEAYGCVVLTARPKALCGESFQKQLALSIHSLVRQADGAAGDQSIERRLAESTTDLLDDVYVAAHGRRLAIFVDDWQACDVSELSFLRRVVMQDQATLGEKAREDGRCQVILGGSGARENRSPSARLLESLIGERITLSLWSRDHLKKLVQQTDPESGLSNAHCERIIQAAGGRPGTAVAILESLSRLESRQDLKTAVETAIECNATAWTADMQAEAEVEELRALPLGSAALALALWGDPLPSDAWKRLVGPLDQADALDTRGVSVRNGTVQTTKPHLAHYLCRHTERAEFAHVISALTTAVAPLWRSSCVDTIASLLRCYCRLARPTEKDNWKVCRALMVLLQHGRFAEVENLASEVARLRPTNSPPWLRYFEVGAQVEAGRAAEFVDLPTSEPSHTLAQYGRWIRARALWRGRNRSAAFAEIQGAARAFGERGAVRSAMLEDLSLLAAELEELDTARQARRQLVHRLVRAEQNTGGATRLDGLRARLHRVRQRKHLTARRYLAASVAARRERFIHESSGNAFGIAAGFNNEGVALLKADRIADAIERFNECTRLRERSDDERGLVVVLNNLALAHNYLAEPSLSAAALNRARVVALRNGLVRHAHVSCLNLGLAYVTSGQLRDARAVFARLVAQSKETGDRDIYGQALLNYATLAADEWHLSVAERALTRLRGSDADRLMPSVFGLKIELALRLRNHQDVESQLSGVAEQELSSVSTEYSALLGASRGVRSSGCELTLTTRIRSAAFRRRALAKATTLKSLRRIRRLASRDVSTRPELEWIAAFFAEAPCSEDVVSLGWEVLGRSDFREGHDDLLIEIRANLGRILRAQGRVQEGWAVLTDALKRFRRLESKILRWGKQESLLEHLYGVLSEAMGIRGRSAGAPIRTYSTLLQSEAFGALMGARSTGRGGEDLVLQLGEALAFTHDPDELMDRVLSLGLRATGAHRALIVTAQGSERNIRRYRLAEGSGGEGGDAQLSWAVLSKVLSTGVPQVYGDALAAEQLTSHRSIAVLNLRSLACVPLQSSRGVIGALYLDHHGMAGLFGEEDLGVLTLLASVVALTLESAETRESAEGWEDRLAEAHRHVVRSERNRLAGQIASGLAHDLKNILTTIVARSQLMMLGKSGTTDKAALKSIEKAAHSAAGMIQKLQECSREHVTQREEAVDLGSLAHEAVELLTPCFSKGTGIDVQVDVDAGVVMQGVAGELRELFLNLIVNACDAMPDGGQLRILVRGDERSEKAVVTVADSGVGMPEEVQERIFEPFFTTKGNEGTGLGLAVVRSAVVRYAGDLEVESTPGEGTTFRITLPIKVAKKETGVGSPK